MEFKPVLAVVAGSIDPKHLERLRRAGYVVVEEIAGGSIRPVGHGHPEVSRLIGEAWGLLSGPGSIVGRGHADAAMERLQQAADILEGKRG